MIAAAARVEVSVAGTVLPYVSAVHVVQRLGQPATCELRVTPGGGPASIAELIDASYAGAALEVLVVGQEQALFAGRLTGLQRVLVAGQPPGLLLRGSDDLHLLARRSRAAVHVAMDAGELAGELAAAHGLELAAAGDPGPRHERIVQHGQSDLALLSEVAGRVGLYPLHADGALRLVGPDGWCDGPALAFGAGLVAATIDLDPGSGAATASATGWDPAEGAMRTSEAGEPRMTRAIPGEPTVDGDLLVTGAALLDSTHAAALARASLERRLGPVAVLTGEAAGDTRMRPGARVPVSDLDAPLCGTWVVANAEHRVTADGYRTRFDTRLPVPAAPAAAAGAWAATVIAVDDPDRLGRVRVAYDALGDGIESGWLQIVGAGMAAVPDRGDRVLVLPLGPDPAQAVVLGALTTTAGASGQVVEGGRVRRAGWKAPGGHRLWFDDVGPSVAIEHAAGHRLLMERGDLVLETKNGNMTISAPGKTITIRAARVDFEQA